MRLLTAAAAALAVVLAAFALLAASRPGVARADGDPASDVLIQQSLYLPQDAALTAKQQAQLAALLSEASRRGFPLRVAVIASRTDLGSVTALYGHPQSYARFLALELSQAFHGPLLVVMPAGLGVANLRSGADGGGQLAAAASIAARGALGAATLAGVQQLATAAGHPVSIPQVDAQSGSGASDTSALAVFAIGALIILAAFVASFRARPPVLGRRSAADV